MPILKADVQAPVLPQERLHLVPELGGEVIVRPLLLSDRLALAQRSMVDGQVKEFKHIAALLASAIVDANHEPLFTVEQWETWGSANMRAALDLWDAAWEMSGLDPAVSKKKSDAGNPQSDDAGAEAGAHA